MLEIVYNFGKIVRNTIYTKKSIGTQSREKYTRQGVELLATYEIWWEKDIWRLSCSENGESNYLLNSQHHIPSVVSWCATICLYYKERK